MSHTEQDSSGLVLVNASDATIVWMAEALADLRDRFLEIGATGHADHVGELLAKAGDFVLQRVSRRGLPVGMAEDAVEAIEERAARALLEIGDSQQQTEDDERQPALEGPSMKALESGA